MARITDRKRKKKKVGIIIMSAGKYMLDIAKTVPDSTLAKVIARDKNNKAMYKGFDVVINLSDKIIMTSKNTVEEARAYARGFQDAYSMMGITLEIKEP